MINKLKKFKFTAQFVVNNMLINYTQTALKRKTKTRICVPIYEEHIFLI